MRVSFANHSSAPVALGGAERSLLQFVSDWCAEDPSLVPTFVTKAPRGTFIDALEQRGMRYDAFRFRGWALPSPQPAPAPEQAAFARADYAAVRGIIDLYKEQRPDLVVTNTLVAPWAAFAAAALGIPHAWFVREYGDLDHGLHFQSGRAATLRDIGLLSGAVIANSEAIRTHLAQYIAPEKLSVAMPRIDTDALRATRAQRPATIPFPRERAGLRIVVVGRVERSKGQHRVIDAIGELRDRGILASACFVGGWKEPGESYRLTDRARTLGIADRITFAGEQANVAPYIDAADVCVTPSTIEAFGRTTAEYMALGRAVIASRQGGSAELVQADVTGMLFDPDDTSQLADALARYAASPELARQHGAAAPGHLASVLSQGNDNAGAIRTLTALVETPGYRLPEIAQYWFGLPEAYASLGTTSARAAIGVLMSRVRTRTGLPGRVIGAPRTLARRLTSR